MTSKQLVFQDKEQKRVKQHIFDEVAEFSYQDFEDLKTNKSYDRFEVGNLEVPSGKIVCTDPMYRALGFPQSWEVARGNYPVNIYIGLEDDFVGRVAYAELVFSEEAIESWQFSLIEESLLKDDFEKKMNGMYPVENGLGSFSDYDVWKEYTAYFSQYQKKSKEANFYTDILDEQFRANNGIPKSSRGNDWVNYKLESGKGNVIMFGSGWGDGLYARYVAFDKQGNPVKLITDFIRISE